MPPAVLTLEGVADDVRVLFSQLDTIRCDVASLKQQQATHQPPPSATPSVHTTPVMRVQNASASTLNASGSGSVPSVGPRDCDRCGQIEAKFDALREAVGTFLRQLRDDRDQRADELPFRPMRRRSRAAAAASSTPAPTSSENTPLYETLRVGFTPVGDTNPLAEPDRSTPTSPRALQPFASSGSFARFAQRPEAGAGQSRDSPATQNLESRGEEFGAPGGFQLQLPATVVTGPSIVVDKADASCDAGGLLVPIPTPPIGSSSASALGHSGSNREVTANDGQKSSLNSPRSQLGGTGVWRSDGPLLKTGSGAFLTQSRRPSELPSRSTSRLVPFRKMSRRESFFCRSFSARDASKGAHNAVAEAAMAAAVRRRAAAALATEKLAQERSAEAAATRRAKSERSPLMVTMDVLFCFSSVVACTNAIGQTHTQGRAFYGPTSVNFPFVLAANAAVSAVSLAWIASRFFLAQRDGWEVVDDLARVRARYVRSWFAFDLVFALPLEYAFFGWQWELFAFAQLRHFLRVARIVNLGSSQHPLLASRLWFRFMSFCFLAALLVLGIAAAFWALQAQHTYEESVYWALATVTSVGYGDVVATDGPSRVYSCFAMFAGVALLSTMTAYATSFLATKNRLEQERETQTQTLHAMLEHYDVPWDVQKEVIGAVPSMLERSNRVAFDRLLERLPGFVAEKVGGYVAAKALLRVPAFASLPREHVLRVARVAEPELRAPDEVVAEEGQRADAAWFVVHGNVRLLTAVLDGDASGSAERSAEANASRAIDLGAVGPGESFGGLDPDDADAVHAATAVCAPACELVALTRGALEELRTETPEAHSAVAALLRPRVVQKDPSMAADVVDARIAIEE